MTLDDGFFFRDRLFVACDFPTDPSGVYFTTELESDGSCWIVGRPSTTDDWHGWIVRSVDSVPRTIATLCAPDRDDALATLAAVWAGLV